GPRRRDEGDAPRTGGGQHVLARGRGLPPAHRSPALTAFDRDHRGDRPADDLLRRLLDAVQPVVDRVVDVNDPPREERVARVAAGDELRQTACGGAERWGSGSTLLRLAGEAALFEAERDHIVVVWPDRSVVVAART